MRIVWPKLAVVLITVGCLVAGCHSDEPTRDTSRTASVAFAAFGSSGPTAFQYDCYEIWYDQDGDNVCDPSTFHNCSPNPPESSGGTDLPIPAHYSATITVIPAGTTTEQVVTSLTGVRGSSGLPGDTLIPFVSMTPYDPLATPIADAACSCAGGNQCLKNGHKVHPGSADYLAANNFPTDVPNVLSSTTPSAVNPTFDFQINVGDTIIVRARKEPDSQAFTFLPWSPPNVQLLGSILVGGATVATATSTVDDRAGLTITYTVQ